MRMGGNRYPCTLLVRGKAMRKILYILLLVSVGLNAQRKIQLDRAAPSGAIANHLLFASIQQSANSVTPSELYTLGDAADPNSETNTVQEGSGATGWHDNSGSDITFTSVAGDATSYAMHMELSGSNAARAEWYVDLSSGVTYDVVIRGRASAASKVRLIDWQSPNTGDYAGISSQPFLTTSWATYNLTVSPSVTETYRVWFDFNGETSGDWGEIESISIIAQ